MVSLVGENGAGKTTLFDILSGITHANAGTVTLAGQRWSPRSLHHAQTGGIARVFQEQSLIADVPVYENLLLGRDQTFYRGGFLQRRAMIRAAQQLIDAAELPLDAERRTGDYPFSQRQTLEIARACLAPILIDNIEHPLILLDEPTASLDREDEQRFLALVAKLRQRASLLLVSHRLSEVRALSDRIYVLKDGQRVAELSAADASENRLHQLMVGRDRAADHYYQHLQQDCADQPVVFTARNLSLPDAYSGISFSVRAGEIVGIGGLLNSGKSRLGKGLAGVIPPASGEIQLQQGVAQRPDIKRLVRQGVGYIPAERLSEGLIAGYDVSWNLGLASGGDRLTTGFGLWRRQLERQTAAKFIALLSIKSASPQKITGELSGGNQQKVVLARWLFRTPRVLVLDNPTRGVDAGAKEELYQHLRALSQQGVAIVLISDELLELIGLSHRIQILQHGRQVGEITAPPDHKPSEASLVALMLNAAKTHALEATL